MSATRTMIFADGENLTLRYQGLQKAGWVASDSVVHFPDVFVWHPNLASLERWNLVRIGYYTSIVGDMETLESMALRIAEVPTRTPSGEGRITPHVFKKPSKSQKTRSVDIGIVIDMMRHAFAGEIETLVLLSGDGDFIPLISDIMRRGKRVMVGAFSGGLCPQLKFASDHFFLLDDMFFHKRS